MTLLLTGPGGFIGQAVASALPRQRTTPAVKLLDRQTPTAPQHRQFTAIGADLTDLRILPALFDSADTTIHHAAIPGAMAEADPALLRCVNLDATFQLLEALDARAPPTWCHPVLATTAADALGRTHDRDLSGLLAEARAAP